MPVWTASCTYFFHGLPRETKPRPPSPKRCWSARRTTAVGRSLAVCESPYCRMRTSSCAWPSSSRARRSKRCFSRCGLRSEPTGAVLVALPPSLGTGGPSGIASPTSATATSGAGAVALATGAADMAGRATIGALAGAPERGRRAPVTMSPHAAKTASGTTRPARRNGERNAVGIVAHRSFEARVCFTDTAPRDRAWTAGPHGVCRSVARGASGADPYRQPPLRERLWLPDVQRVVHPQHPPHARGGLDERPRDGAGRRARRRVGRPRQGRRPAPHQVAERGARSGALDVRPDALRVVRRRRAGRARAGRPRLRRAEHA